MSTSVKERIRLFPSRIRAGDCTVEWDSDLLVNLNDELDTRMPLTPVRPGELAHQTLLLPCQQERNREPILTLISGPPERTRFGLAPAIATLPITTALFALQTHTGINRDEDGHGTFKSIQKPTTDSTVIPIMDKLLTLVTNTPPGAKWSGPNGACRQRFVTPSWGCG